MSNNSIRSFCSHAFPCLIMSFCMLWFSWLAIKEPNDSTAISYLVVASVSFTLTMIGYWGYCKYHVPKHSHSPLLAIIYTLLFPFIYLPRLFYKK